MEIGGKIRFLRQKCGLTMEELADRCELSKGFISLLERDLASPSISTLSDILECLGSDLKSFFDDSAPEKAVFSQNDMSVKEYEEDMHGSIKWLVPNAQKNSMEPILVEMRPGGKSELHAPHAGEEFGYVLSGTIILHIGERKMRVRREESFYFRSEAPHYVENAGKVAARLIWVSTPPSF